MSQHFARVLPLALAVLSALPAGAQPPGEKNRLPDKAPFSDLESPYTAFPDLRAIEYENKDVPRPGGGTERQTVARNPIAVPALPAPRPDDPPLRKVRRAQARAGLTYLARVADALRVVGPDPSDFDRDLRMAAETYRVAAELEDRPSRRVPWYEARVRTLKEVERYTLLRVKTGSLPSGPFHQVCFERLRAEADLLALKGAVAEPEPGARRMPEPRRPELLDDEPVAPKYGPGRFTEPYTAFPDLKPPTKRSEQTPDGKVIEEGRVPPPQMVIVPEDAPPLLRARRERVNAGLAYLTRVAAAREIVGPDPFEYSHDATFATCVFRAAAELEPRLADRVPWYEAIGRTLKELEHYTRLRVEAGGLKPQRLDEAQFRRLDAEADLLALLAASQQAGAGAPVTALAREPFENKKLTPGPVPNAYTAFPALKPPPQPPTGPSWQQRIDELLAGTKPLTPSPNEAPLQCVRREQVLGGLAFLRWAQRSKEIAGPNPNTFFLEQAFVADLCRAAAEREPNRADGVAWREACVRMLKESEEYTELRVQAGALKPQRHDEARFDRLGAEIELLLLKAETDGPATNPAAQFLPTPACVPAHGPRVQPRAGLLGRFRLCR